MKRSRKKVRQGNGNWHATLTTQRQRSLNAGDGVK